MAYNTKSIIKDINQKPVPQIFNPATDAYEVVQGANGASRVLVYDINGNPIDLTALLTNIVTVLNQKNLPAGASTLAKQDAIITAVNSIVTELGKKSLAAGASTSAKQDEIKTAIETIYNKDTTKTFYGLSTDIKPTSGMIKGNVYFEIDTSKVFMWNGTTWVVI